MDKRVVVVISVSMTAALGCVLVKAAGAPPNVESIMPFAMAAGLAMGPAYGFVNALIARAAFDGYQAWAGWWTVLTSLSYGLVGMLAGLVVRYKKKWNRVELAFLAGALAVVYDAVTMLAFGLPFGIPVGVLVAGQIPFTISHVLSSMAFGFVLAPTLVGWISGYVNEEPVKTTASFTAPCPATGAP